MNSLCSFDVAPWPLSIEHVNGLSKSHGVRSVPLRYRWMSRSCVAVDCVNVRSTVMSSPVNSGTLYQSSLSGQIWLPVDENVGYVVARAVAAALSGSLLSSVHVAVHDSAWLA